MIDNDKDMDGGWIRRGPQGRMTMGPGMDNRWMDNKDKEEGWIRRWTRKDV